MSIKLIWPEFLKLKKFCVINKLLLIKVKLSKGICALGSQTMKLAAFLIGIQIRILDILIPSASQLPGRRFSPGDISKKLSRHFLLHFPIGMGSYDHHAKYQGVFPDLLQNTFFIKVPPLNSFKFSLSKGGTLMKKVFSRRSGNTQWYIAWWS